MVNTILEFEQNSNILDYKYTFNNEIMWIHFRGVFLQKVMSVTTQLEKVAHVNEKERNFFKYNVLKNPFIGGNKDILFIHESHLMIENDKGEYVNPLIDYYADVYENNTTIIEYKYSQDYPKKRAFKDVKYMDLINRIINADYLAHKNEIDPRDRIMISKFVNHLKENFPIKFDEGFYKGIEEYAIRLSVQIKYYYKYYYKLIMNLKPKVIFCLCACYLGATSCITRIANELGIVTAEFQHSSIPKSNFVYNYSENFSKNNDFLKYLPKYFLTMGEYWEKNTKLPCKKIVIGHPRLYKSIENVKINEEKNTILIICDPEIKKVFIKLAKEFCEEDKLKKYTIIFRIHPAERKMMKLFSELNEFSNIIISDVQDVYEDISRCENIVGGTSTVLYECIPFNKKIFIIKDDYCIKNIDMNIGAGFNDAKELFNLIDENALVQVTKNINYYWNSEWKSNYINFIEKVVYNKK